MIQTVRVKTKIIIQLKKKNLIKSENGKREKDKEVKGERDG